MRCGESVADSLHDVVHIGLRGIHDLYGARVLAPRERAQYDADLAEAPLQEVFPDMCEVPYGLVSGRVELAHGGRADIDHLGFYAFAGDGIGGGVSATSRRTAGTFSASCQSGIPGCQT